jgi:hypothetical protein
MMEQLTGTPSRVTARIASLNGWMLSGTPLPSTRVPRGPVMVKDGVPWKPGGI